MSDILLDDDAEASAMAEAMGFSGFGSQRPAKRKFNANADAVIDLDPSVARKGGNVSKTGANNAPLGARRQLPSMPPSLPPRPHIGAGVGAGAVDPDQIDLGEGEEGMLDTANSAFHHASGASGSNVSTWQLEDGLAPDSDTISGPPQLQTAMINGPPGLPARPPQPSFGRGQKQPHGRGGRGGRGSDHHYHPSGGAGVPWWEGYHDAKMNENPWEKLEMEKGLQPRGTWVARNGGPGHAVPAPSRGPETKLAEKHETSESVVNDASGATARPDASVLTPEPVVPEGGPVGLTAGAEP